MKTYISIHDVDKGLYVAEVQASSKCEAIKEFHRKYNHLITYGEIFAIDFFVRKCDAMYRIDCYMNGYKIKVKYCMDMLHAMTISLHRAKVLCDALTEADDAIIIIDTLKSEYEVRVSTDHTRFEVIRNKAEVLYSFEVRRVG